MTARRITLETMRKDLVEHSKSDLKYFKKFSESVKQIADNQDAHLKEFKEFRAEMKPVQEAFDGVRWSGWAIAKAAGLVGAVAGAIFAVKQVWNWNR